MNRRFRLATLERLRRTRVDDAAAALATARRALADAAAEHEALVAASRLCVVGAEAGAVSAPEALAGAGLRREVLRERAERQAAVVSRRRDEVAAALGSWHEARAALRAVEALHERHRVAVAEADARQEQRLTDEAALTAARRLRVLTAVAVPAPRAAPGAPPAAAAAADPTPDGGDAA